MSISSPSAALPLPRNCDCAICCNIRDFAVPVDLMRALYARELVLFAGAGISTENRTVFPSTFYEDICCEITPPPVAPLSFPDAMEEFCRRPNGRRELIHRIRERLTYAECFPEVYQRATRFHRELASLFYIDVVVTTNWDDFFERECGAQPFVHDSDFALWSLDGRKVLKIHGSINAIGSLVATASDYRKCHRRLARGVLGAQLKAALATKTLVYVGYSLTDPDFLRLRREIEKQMGSYFPHSYVVSPNAPENAQPDSRTTTIGTDGAHFLSVIKQHMAADPRSGFVQDDRFSAIVDLLYETHLAHSRLWSSIDVRKHPMGILSASYQDGLMHSLERIVRRQRTGEYSHRCRVESVLGSYGALWRTAARRRNYWDAAYIEGYRSGLMYLLGSDTDRRHVPLYYRGPRRIATVTGLRRFLSTQGNCYPAIRTKAEAIVRKKHRHGTMSQHTPFL